MTGGLGKENRTNKLPPTRRVRKRQKDTTCLTTSQNPSCWHLSWLNKECTTRKDSESERLAKDNLETNSITITVAEQFSWLPLLHFSPPGCPVPITSLALSARVSSDNSFLSIRQEPSFGPWKGFTFL